eukprot:GHRQ01023063.1.p2 GENE.GHRQ01023063.1~~GHRQ01023063.1.p2  ORF type:complete len:135 (+),score=58.15 GHRQ01023063.1:441-845(+)
MRRALDEAKENEVLLLEAYEQLEADVGQEVDRALAKQADELARVARRVQFLEGHLEAERRQVALLGEEGARLEGRLADASSRNAQYESGVYGLPQVGAVRDVLRNAVQEHQCMQVKPHPVDMNVAALLTLCEVW